jgi:hypothetical protein
MTQPREPDPNRVQIIALPGGLQANVLGLVVDVGPTFVDADRRGILGQILADLTTGSAAEQAAATEHVLGYAQRRAELVGRHQQREGPAG